MGIKKISAEDFPKRKNGPSEESTAAGRMTLI